MDAFLLVVADTARAKVVLPRKVALRLSPGEGTFQIESKASLAPEWRASVHAGWLAARRLAGRDDADATLVVTGEGAMVGRSAGAQVGLLSLAALLDRPLPPHFATGTLLGDAGFLEGGLAFVDKARAAAALGPQMDMRPPVLVAPPGRSGSDPAGLRVIRATDLGTAYAKLDSAGYAGVRARHDAMRTLPKDLGLDPEQPFVVLRSAQASDATGKPGLQVAKVRDPTLDSVILVEVGERGRVLWSVRAAPPVDIGQAQEWLDLARAAV